MSELPRNTILVGDALEHLRTLPSASIDTVITSPPYFQLRRYGMGEREYGQEPNVDEWVAQLRGVCAEIHRVLVPTGSLWLNLGDSYSRHDKYGAPAKSLLLGPERLALALIADGWRLRNSAVWAKTNPMPSSVRDRLTCTWENVYFFTKQSTYHFDLDAIRVPHRTTRPTKPNPNAGAYLPTAWRAPLSHDNNGLAALKRQGRVGHPAGKNPGDVWNLATARYAGAHFATFPTSLVDLPIRSTCPPRRCLRCRIPVLKQIGRTALRSTTHYSCRAPSEPGIVLDPFMGSGTVGVAAEQHGRDWIGIELNPQLARLANERIADARPAQPEGRAA
ncbi:MAG: site-specific DNA-methyltransferase [Ilumatobacter sp.]|uniref:DNA-methyltransferase n=1 Tax=Ilumatobacter sp. TaxID=1967498 RepID=UPI002617D597|nr:site-specific DNA-methyltransferase [Ilumatobacter sp.]MDJ0769420.1 site-specific DNA-methyltransferase [Ilumatobacter sp.]